MEVRILKYHFAAPTKEKIIEFSKNIYNLGAVLCFDFEDIVKALPVALDNVTLRNLHRKDVIDTIEILLTRDNNPKISIRMNACESGEFYEDLAALRSINSKLWLDSIFLPKVESSLEIEKCSSILYRNGIRFEEIIPIIENKAGYDGLEQIIKYSKIKINKIAFGHCDYNFSLDNFPFYHQNTDEYWGWVDHLLSITIQNKITFINSPYLYLSDDAGFIFILNRISEKANGSSGQITLSVNQLKLCNNAIAEHISKGYKFIMDIPDREKPEYAQKIITDFESNKLQNRSFSLDKGKRIIISPQEYLAAKEYLKTSAT